MKIYLILRSVFLSLSICANTANASDIKITKAVSYKNLLEKDYKDSELIYIREYSKNNNLSIKTEYNIRVSKKIIHNLVFQADIEAIIIKKIFLIQRVDGNLE